MFYINDKKPSRVGWNDFLGRIWPEGGSLETLTPKVDLQNLRTYKTWILVLERLVDASQTFFKICQAQAFGRSSGYFIYGFGFVPVWA